MNLRKHLIAGNWKMNGTLDSISEILKIDKLCNGYEVDIALCLPNTIISKANEHISHKKLVIGAQNCHHDESGAYTGDVSAKMLKDAGAKIIIVGHSERRQNYKETNEIVNKKAVSIIKSALQTIICVGETEEEKNMGLTNKIVCTQLENSMPSISDENNTVIAYEPIWAIGTGRIPTIKEIEVVHKELRSLVSKIKGIDTANKMRILYGGSVKPNNAKDIFDLDDVDGALVGGASLKSDDFMGIINVC
jgi:triosephosphate isomerase